ncbi:Receptor-type tyrosine-protein phosphatase delta [Geodia barretti]|uniref:Receptor-type tyrosine-protein phosphatase delta n=1 Tax=Geodia barretti TaxID=519541 RepID=A0AA35SHI5_GEOBA|nr:Receptor-type tyrosine-protein phosphatase delta [Geodia barretti]
MRKGTNKKTHLANEYEELPDQFQSESKVACLPHNIPKNKFKNIYPFDESRVCLTNIPGKHGSDYINASFIDGYRKKKQYIAAQGPLKETVEDFWRMVCQYKVEAIVMLTRCVEMGKVSKPQPFHQLSEPPSTTHHFIMYEPYYAAVSDMPFPSHSVMG